MSQTFTNVKSHKRKNGSFIVSHIRKIISKLSYSEDTQKPTSLTGATSQLTYENPSSEDCLNVHENERWVSHISGENLAGHSWKKSSLVGASFNTCNFDETIFDDTDMGASFRMCSFNGAIANKSDLTGALFIECQLNNVDLSKSVAFNKANFYECDLSGANLSGVKIDSTSSISKCNFENADFSNADLRGARIYDCNIVGVNWRGARTEGMIVSENEDPRRLKDELWAISSVLREITGTKKPLNYSHYSFSDAVKLMNLTEKQFEFLASSGGIEIRDCEGVRVTSHFDLEKHHVPAWVVQNFSIE